MATIISHPIVPLALGWVLGGHVVSRRLVFAGMLCAILPDLDVLMFRFGIPYGSPFGHRGFTHSLFFALLTAALVAMLARPLRTAPRTAFLFAAFATASHGLLDALTTGGLGVAFFWPFSQERHFFPYQFILVSPIGLKNFLTLRGWLVLKSELLTIWLPCALFVATAQTIRLRKHHDRPTRIHPG